MKARVCALCASAAGLEGWFRMDTPCTPERLRMACADEFTQPYATPDLLPYLSC